MEQSKIINPEQNKINIYYRPFTEVVILNNLLKSKKEFHDCSRVIVMVNIINDVIIMQIIETKPLKLKFRKVHEGVSPFSSNKYKYIKIAYFKYIKSRKSHKIRFFTNKFKNLKEALNFAFKKKIL